jgi:putative membrane protein
MAEWIVLTAGSVLVLFSSFYFAAAVWRELFPGPPPPPPDVAKLPAVLLIAPSVILILVALVALAGIWLARTPGH